MDARVVFCCCCSYLCTNVFFFFAIAAAFSTSLCSTVDVQGNVSEQQNSMRISAL